jgi:hypothetical protein
VSSSKSFVIGGGGSAGGIDGSGFDLGEKFVMRRSDEISLEMILDFLE